MSKANLNQIIALSIIAYFGYQFFMRKNKGLSGVPEGWKVSIDPDLAVDMIGNAVGIEDKYKPFLKMGARGLNHKLSQMGKGI